MKSAKKTVKRNVAVDAKNEAPKTETAIKLVSNAPAYDFDASVRDSLQSTKTNGRAEAGMATAMFNIDGPQAWTLKACENYFRAPTTQTVEDKKTGKKHKDTNIETRTMFQTTYLNRCPEFKTAWDELNLAKAEVKAANKAKPKDALRITRAEFTRDALNAPILATQARLHRAIMSVFEWRKSGVLRVSMDAENNALTIVDAKGNETMSTVSSVREAGVINLKKDGLIATRPPRPKASDNNGAALSNVDATTAGPVIDKLSDLIATDDLKLPVTSNDGSGMTLENIATMALATMIKISRDDLAKSADLRGTLSGIAIELNRLLKTDKKTAARKTA